jgi:large subunit ribosomal protein L30
MKNKKLLKITLKKSAYGRHPKHRATIKALGLKKIGQSVIKEDVPSIRGMIKTVEYLLQVEEFFKKEENESIEVK